jgi:hypothetical protein
MKNCPVKKAFAEKKPELYILLSPFLCNSKTCHKCEEANAKLLLGNSSMEIKK